MALAEVAENTPKMHRQMSGVTEFLVPFFVVNIGMNSAKILAAKNITNRVKRTLASLPATLAAK